MIGELVPKSLALRYSDRYSFFVARPLLALLAADAAAGVGADRGVEPRAALLRRQDHVLESRLSRDELQQLVEEAAKTGSVDPRASEIASRALGFGEVTVAEVMVPRTRVVALPRGAPREEQRRRSSKRGHSRMPVYDGNSTTSSATSSPATARARVGEGSSCSRTSGAPCAVPESMRALDLLARCSRRRHADGGRRRRPRRAVGPGDHRGPDRGARRRHHERGRVAEQYFVREPDGTSSCRAGRPCARSTATSTSICPWRRATTIAGLCMSLRGDPRGGREAHDRRRHGARGDRARRGACAGCACAYRRAASPPATGGGPEEGATLPGDVPKA